MKKLLILTLGIVFIGFAACEKTVDDPVDNPFEGGSATVDPTDSVDPYSIQGLHKNIFAVKCANPTCHDGSFEPDFRTVQSTYNSLVYQPVIKNNPQGEFTYRVVPGKVAESWLFERLITGDPVLGRMPLYAPALSNQELLWVSGWIGDGARDLNGNVADFPNLPPAIRYYFATNAANERIDTNRLNGWSSPFVVPAGSAFNINIWIEDDSTATQDLLVNQLKISTQPDDFSNATVFNATYFASKLWTIALTANQFPANTQLYFRYYVEDPDNSGLTEYPRNDLPYYFKENASFIIQ
jgi:hypothetical protein